MKSESLVESEASHLDERYVLFMAGVECEEFTEIDHYHCCLFTLGEGTFVIATLAQVVGGGGVKGGG